MEDAGTTSPVRSLVRWLGGAASPANGPAVPGRPAVARVAARALPYVLSAATVALAVYGALFLRREGFRGMGFPLLLFAIASNIWYPALGPTVVALVLSAAAFDYYFTEPRYSFVIAASDIPYFVTFLLFALMLASFGVVRRRIERRLVESSDRLRTELAEGKAREEQIGRLNEQLARRSTELEAINGELEAFAYSVSHDLSAPLRHMVGFAELLQKSAGATLDDKGRRYLATILDAARRMGQLIDDLLAFSRIARAEAQATEVGLRQLVKEVVEEMGPELAARKVSWAIRDLPVVHGDRSMLRVVLVNLLSNALKFTRTRPQAEIEVGSFEDERGVVVFVKDNGVGFDPKYRSKLFRVFQRLHRTDEFEGTGIGLATVQRVVHRHGGTVWAEGAIDGGATFFFSVPRVAGAPITR